MAGFGDNKVRVLVVEDDPPSRRMMVQRLRKFGFEVDATGTPSGAREKLLLRPECLLLDLSLSATDAGLKLLRELRAGGAAVRIAVTSGADPTVLEECARLGAEVFRKPVDVESVAQWIAGR